MVIRSDLLLAGRKANARKIGDDAFTILPLLPETGPRGVLSLFASETEAFIEQEMIFLHKKYIIREDRDLFYLYCLKAFETQRRLSTEIRFEMHGGGRMYAPPLQVHLGLEKAISSHAQGFQEKHPHIKLHIDLQPTRMVLSQNMDLALYRIYQEATHNITKHALPEASKVTVRLKKDEYLVQLEIHDNGQGLELPEQWLDFAENGRLGLSGMRERAEAVGGSSKLRPGPAAGRTSG